MKYDCIELSYAELTQKCREWCKKIEKDFQPQLVIFIAKAGYIAGSVIAEYFKVPLIGIHAERKGNRIKIIVAPIFRRMPNFIRNYLIGRELTSEYHGKNQERNVYFLNDISEYVGAINNVLIVDDSVDTGVSLLKVKQIVEQRFGIPVRTASVNVWDKSKNTILVDYVLYSNTIIRAPTSKDSKEHPEFLKKYKEYIAM